MKKWNWDINQKSNRSDWLRNVLSLSLIVENRRNTNLPKYATVWVILLAQEALGIFVSL